MAVFGTRAWWRALRAASTVPDGDASRAPAEPTDQEGPVPLDDSTLKSYAMQQPEWTEALIRVESARVDGEIRLLSVRLLLGTACGSVLLFSVTMASRVAAGVPFGAATPLTTAVLGAIGAALVTALGAGLGRTLRLRSENSRVIPVSGSAPSRTEPPPEHGSEPGSAP
jgi:hypothetical protein